MTGRQVGLVASMLFTLFAVLQHSSARAQTCVEAPESQICTQQEPLVDVETQRELGLVAISSQGGDCSGTLVNRWWVLTADHCVTTDGSTEGATDVATRVTAAWTTRSTVPSRIVRQVGGRDIALMFLGGGDLGPANTQLFFVPDVDTARSITKYGRGIHVYATGADPASAAPSRYDGRYRSAQFTHSMLNEDFITVTATPGGRIPAAGDSGGPDIVITPDGVRLAGVSSWCDGDGIRYVPRMPRTWTWATNVSSCSSVNLAPIRHAIVSLISETAPRASNGVDDDNRPDVVWHEDITGQTRTWVDAR